VAKRGIDGLGELRGKRVLCRVDFNVPLEGSGKDRRVGDDYRLESTLPTLRRLLDAGARVILCSHLGRPKGRDPELSLAPVGARLGELLEREVRFVDEVVGERATRASQELQDGQVLLLENTRFEPGEKKNDPELAKRFAALADLYVNDAFGASHRADATVAGVPQLLPGAAGDLVLSELRELAPLRDGSAARPLAVVLGGAKLADKIPVLEALIPRVDKILIGGGMAYTFMKAMGKPIGGSRFDAETVEAAGQILEKARERSRQGQQMLLLPRDHVVARSPDDVTGYSVVEQIPDDLMALDVGPATIADYVKQLAGVKTVFWNGPLGVFEKQPFHLGTHYVASFLAWRKHETKTIVGGGDSAAAARALGLAEHMHWVSTGGGASLEYVEGQDLPGLSALPDV